MFNKIHSDDDVEVYGLMRGWHQVRVCKLSNGSCGFAWSLADDPQKNAVYLSFSRHETEELIVILQKMVGASLAS